MIALKNRGVLVAGFAVAAALLTGQIAPAFVASQPLIAAAGLAVGLGAELAYSRRYYKWAEDLYSKDTALFDTANRGIYSYSTLAVLGIAALANLPLTGVPLLATMAVTYASIGIAALSTLPPFYMAAVEPKMKEGIDRVKAANSGPWGPHPEPR